MKNIIITLLVAFFSLTCYSQDCIDIKDPNTHKVLSYICGNQNIEKELERLNEIHKLDVFILEFTKDGDIYGCFFYKIKSNNYINI